MRQIKKTIYLLDVDGYEPEITALTRPTVEAWADKIEASVRVITSRLFPGWPPAYEKLQVGRLAKERGDDWAIYLDSDALVHQETPDFTALIAKDTVLHNGCDWSPVRWVPDEYMLRDGRWIGSCNWLAIASDWCLDLWTPLDITLDEAVRRIRPTVIELQSGVIDAAHLVDDYTLSRNIARYGLKFRTVMELVPGNWFWHAYDIPAEEKLARMVERLSYRSWGGDVPDPDPVGA
jgi:hypothetical protein